MLRVAVFLNTYTKLISGKIVFFTFPLWYKGEAGAEGNFGAPIDPKLPGYFFLKKSNPVANKHARVLEH